MSLYIVTRQLYCSTVPSATQERATNGAKRQDFCNRFIHIVYPERLLFLKSLECTSTQEAKLVYVTLVFLMHALYLVKSHYIRHCLDVEVQTTTNLTTRRGCVF